MLFNNLVCVLVLLLLLAEGTLSEPGKWSNHRRRSRYRTPAPTLPSTTTTSSTTTRTTTVTTARSVTSYKPLWTNNPPIHRCQVPRYTTLPGGAPVNLDYVASVSELLLEDKLILAPLVFEGVMVSRTNTYKGLYFVSFKVIKVMKGKLHPLLQDNVRLLFQTKEPRFVSSRRLKLRGNACPPVPFSVRSGRRYLIFVKKISVGRYVAIAEPEPVRRRSRKMVSKTLCSGCVSAPRVGPLPKRTIRDGRNLKLKCKLDEVPHPPPTILWFKDGRSITPSSHVTIQSKKKRSRLVISAVDGSSGGMYTCQASNIIGSSQSSSLVIIRQNSNGGIREASRCPIESFCLNGGTCLYYEMIGELVCRCTEGFAGQRCQFKKARLHPSFVDSSACGPYGHDIQLAEICAAWNSPPIKEMTKEEYDEWKEMEARVKSLKKNKLG